nr:MAG: hypothetical protein [Guiyang bunya-like virus 1]
MDFDMRNDFLALLENFHEHDASKIAFAFESPVNENYAIQRLIDFYSNQQNSKEIYGITMPKLDDINSPRGIRFNYLDLGGVGDCGARAFLAGTGLEFSVDTIYDIITKIYGKGFSKYDKEGNYTWLCDDHISYLCYLTGYNCLIEAVSPYNQEEVLLTMDFGFKRDLRFKHVHGVHWVVYPNISCDWDYYFTSLLFLGFIVKSRHESVEKYLLHDGITLNFIELFRAFSPILNNNDILNKLDFYIKKTEKEISDIKSSLGDDLPNRLSLHNMLMQYMSENQLDYIKINHKVLEDIKENYFYIEDCIDKMIISLEPGQKLMLSDTLEELVNSISDSFDLYKRYILLKSFNKYLNIDNLDFFVPRPDEVVASILNDSGLNLWEKWIESSTTLSKSLFSMETFIQRMVIKPKVQDIVDILHMYSNKIQKSVFGEIYDVRKIFVEEQSVYKASTSLKENLKKLNKLKNIAAIPFNLNTSLNFGAVIEDCEEIYYINEITRELILFILDLIHEEFTANVMEKQLDQDLQELEIGFIKKDILIPDAFEDDNTIFKQTPVNDENPEEKITDSDEREKERIESEHEEEGETEEEKIEETEEEEEEEEVEEEAAGEEEKELTDKEKEDSEEDEEEGDSEEDFSYTPCFNELSQVVIQPVKDFLKIIVDSYTARKSAGKAFNSWVKWGDISTSEEEEDFEKQGTDSERDYISEDERILQLESDEEKTHKEDNHVCWTAFCNGNVVWDKLPMLYENNKLRIINDDNFNCLIKTFDELQSVLNFYMDDFLTDKLKHNSVYYLKALENYFHFRHDIFATCFQMASKQLAPITVFGTDYSFKKYGLKSKKTPDLIYQKDNKTIFIIEFSVSSDVKKSAYQKGNTLERSKYIKEIEELKEKEYTVYWIPAYLSSSDWHDNSSDFMETLTKGGIFFLHDVYKMYLEIWKNMTPNLRMLDRIGYLVIGPDQLKLPKWMTKNSEDLLNVILSKGVYKGIDTAEHVMSVNSDLHKHVLIDIDNLISRLCYDKENYIRLIFEKRKIRMLRRDETVNKSKKQKASTLVNYLLNENFYEFYKYVDIYQGGVYHSCINYQPCILIKGTKDEKKIVNNNDHEECKVPEIAADIEKINLTKNTITLKMSEPWHFDYDDYEKMIELAQSNANLLGNCTISDEVVKSAVKQLQEEQKN